MLIVDSPYRVFEDGGIAITQFVVLLYQHLLSFVVAFRGKLLGFEEILQFASFVNFTKGTLLKERACNLTIL